MNHDTNVNPDSHAEHGEHGDMVKTIWRTFWIMLIVTVVEIVAALMYPHTLPRLPLNAFFIVMSLTKAFYIVAVFMHLKFEKKALATTILLPSLFLIYAIIVMLVEGNYWLDSVIIY